MGWMFFVQPFVWKRSTFLIHLTSLRFLQPFWNLVKLTAALRYFVFQSGIDHAF